MKYLNATQSSIAISQAIAAIDFFFKDEVLEAVRTPGCWNEANLLRSWLEIHRADRLDLAIYRIAMIATVSLLTEEGVHFVGQRSSDLECPCTWAVESFLLSIYQSREEEEDWDRIKRRVIETLQYWYGMDFRPEDMKQISVDICGEARDDLREIDKSVREGCIKHSDPNGAEEVEEEVSNLFYEIYGISVTEFSERLSI